MTLSVSGSCTPNPAYCIATHFAGAAPFLYTLMRRWSPVPSLALSRTEDRPAAPMALQITAFMRSQVARKCMAMAARGKAQPGGALLLHALQAPETFRGTNWRGDVRRRGMCGCMCVWRGRSPWWPGACVQLQLCTCGAAGFMSLNAHVCTAARSSLVSVGAKASRAEGSAPRPLANHLSSSTTEAGAWWLAIVALGAKGRGWGVRQGTLRLGSVWGPCEKKCMGSTVGRDTANRVEVYSLCVEWRRRSTWPQPHAEVAGGKDWLRTTLPGASDGGTSPSNVKSAGQSASRYG